MGQIGGIQPAGDIFILACSVPILLVQPFVCMVPFKMHLMSQTISFLLSTVNNVQLCEKCERDPSDQTVFRNIEAVLDMIGTTLVASFDIGNQEAVVASMTRPVQSPCRLVVLFGLLWIGWMLPNLLAYSIEKHYRRRFLLNYVELHGGCAANAEQCSQVRHNHFLMFFTTGANSSDCVPFFIKLTSQS